MLSDYAKFHQDRQCLLLHLFLVPMFAAALAYAAYCLLARRFGAAAVSLAVVFVSLAIQGVGHKREAVPPEPFNGPVDFVRRVLGEQYYRFWAFLFSGEFSRAYRRSRSAHDA
jgi:hypothetical protein